MATFFGGENFSGVEVIKSVFSDTGAVGSQNHDFLTVPSGEYWFFQFHYMKYSSIGGSGGFDTTIFLTEDDGTTPQAVIYALDAVGNQDNAIQTFDIDSFTSSDVDGDNKLIATYHDFWLGPGQRIRLTLNRSGVVDADPGSITMHGLARKFVG